MEEAQTKLKLLIEKAQKQNIDLMKVPAIEQKKLLKVSRNFKLFVAVLVLLTIYGMFNDLFNSDKVKINFVKSFQVNSKYVSVLNRDAERFRQSVSKARRLQFLSGDKFRSKNLQHPA